MERGSNLETSALSEEDSLSTPKKAYNATI